MLSNKKLRQRGTREPVAVIGGGASGCMVSMMLNSLELGPVMMLEADKHAMGGLATSLNSVGNNHHMTWGGHPPTMEHLFKCAVLFREIVPHHVCSVDRVNFYVPRCTPDGQMNSAVHRDGQIDEISYRANADRLNDLYRRRVEDMGGEPVFGPVDEFVRLLAEEDLATMIGGRPPAGNSGKWLMSSPHRDAFVGAVQVGQNVINSARFAVHLIDQLDRWQKRSLLKILTDHRVLQVSPANGGGFEVVVDTCGEQRRFWFHDVINCGYAGGIGISLPGSRDDGLYAALKIFGLYEVPAELRQTFVSFILIRGQFASAVRAGATLVSVCSGTEFDRDTITFDPGPICGRRIPEHWIGLDDPKRLRDALGGTETELLERIRHDVARWVPVVGGFRPVALKAAPHLYPRDRANADDVSAAGVIDPEITDHHYNPDGGQYFRIIPRKKTGIPFASALAALNILQPHVDDGLVSPDEVAHHVRIDDGYVELSDELKAALGRDAPMPTVLRASSLMAERYNIPRQYLD